MARIPFGREVWGWPERRRERREPGDWGREGPSARLGSGEVGVVADPGRTGKLGGWGGRGWGWEESEDTQDREEKRGAKDAENDTDPLALGTVRPPPLLF